MGNQIIDVGDRIRVQTGLTRVAVFSDRWASPVSTQLNYLTCPNFPR